eukprot:TRINITY_DN6981_c0_g1_i1.p1 TRINITY_DN6981_c0_g1~~TRINITY_DN6981_c0_g1_i1.p1  ORF type:complete len:1107 (-),score=304.83 TRINITY_DN6981_c0_g1_i1:11-3331(-)
MSEESQDDLYSPTSDMPAGDESGIFLPSMPNRRPPTPPVREEIEETFYDEDTEQNIIFDEDDPTKIKGATFTKLVAKLTDPRGLDTNLLYDFLLTYRSFSTSFELLDALIERNKTAREDEKKFVWLRVFNVLKQWIERYYYDFDKDNPTLGERTNAFLEEVINDPDVDTGSVKVAKGVKEKLDKKLRGEDTQTTAFVNTNPPKPILKNSTGNLTDMDPEEVARQLTLVEWDLWKKIEPWECLNLAWTKKDKEERAPNLLTMIDRFNLVSGWVASTICTIENQNKRCKAAKKFVQIADALYRMGNFNGVMEIISGLNRGPVYRMKATVAAITTKDKACNKTLEFLKELTDRQKNYANMRSALRNANPPLIPYLGMYLTDLTFIEEGNPDTIGEYNLIHFYKCRLISNSISSIKQYQQQPYNFVPVPEIIEKLNNAEVHDEDTLYEASYYLEPRNPNERPVKPAIFGGKRFMQDDDIQIDLEFIQGWPFYPRDGPSNLNLDDDNNIISATITKIVERLTHKNHPDTAALGPFLCTFRAFSNSEELLNLLIQRYLMPEPKDKSTSTLESFTNHVRVPIFLRVFNVLKIWISTHWYDFEANENVKQTLLDFINGPFMENSTNFARTMLDLIAKLESPVPREISNPPEPIMPDASLTPDTACILDFDITEIARQLCLITQRYFGDVQPNELILLAAQDPENMDIPTIGMYEDFIYQLENWVDYELIHTSSKTATGILINRFVQIASKCSEFNCWPAVQSILSSLEKTFVTSRKADWASVGFQERRFFFETKELLFLEKNRAKKEARMSDLNPPAIPLLDGYISEISAAHAQYPKERFSDTLINFERYKNVGMILGRFRQMQKVPYSFVSIDLMQEYLNIYREPVEDILTELPEPPEEVEEQALPSMDEVLAPEEKPSSTNENISTKFHVIGMEEAGITKVPPSELKSFLTGLLLNDDEFKAELSVLVKEVWAEEIELLRQEITQLSDSLTFDLHGGTEGDVDLGNAQAAKVIETEFPGSQIREWSFYDEAGTITGNPENISIKLVKEGGMTHICDVIPTTTPEELNRMLKLGKLYKSRYPGEPISCLIITGSIDESTTQAATKCKIRVIVV